MKKLTLFVFLLLITVAYARIIVMSGSSGGGTPFVDDANTLALYHLDEGTGTSAGDETGNYDATCADNWTTGKFSGGLQCETDVENFVQATLLDVTPSAITIEMWFKSDANISSISSPNYMVRKINADNDNMEIRINSSGDYDGKVHFWTKDGIGSSTTLKGTTTIWTAGTWYYVVFIWDTVRGKEIWVNGVMENSIIGETTLMGNGTSEDFRIVKTSNYFVGVIDEIRVSDIARTQAEIEAHWNANKP